MCESPQYLWLSGCRQGSRLKEDLEFIIEEDKFWLKVRRTFIF